MKIKNIYRRPFWVKEKKVGVGEVAEVDASKKELEALEGKYEIVKEK